MRNTESNLLQDLIKLGAGNHPASSNYRLLARVFDVPEGVVDVALESTPEELIYLSREYLRWASSLRRMARRARAQRN